MITIDTTKAKTGEALGITPQRERELHDAIRAALLEMEKTTPLDEMFSKQFPTTLNTALSLCENENEKAFVLIQFGANKLMYDVPGVALLVERHNFLKSVLRSVIPKEKKE